MRATRGTNPYLYGGTCVLPVHGPGPWTTLRVSIPHGQGTRTIDVSVSIPALVAFADAVRACHGCYEDRRTGERPKSMAQVRAEPRFALRYEGHAYWHLANPDAVCPCLDDNATIIDVPDAFLALDATPPA